MLRQASSILISILAACGLPAVVAFAQDKPAAPAAPASPTPNPVVEEAPAGSEDAPLAGADGAEDSEEAQRQRQRRLMMMSTSAILKVGDKTISLNTGALKTESPDYASIAAVKPGHVLQLTRSQAIKLKTAIPLTFGDLALKTENVAKNYPGVYGVWLKKTAAGWNLVFNQKPDVWGTMYDPATNVGEIPAEYTAVNPPTEALAFALTQEGEGGVLKITWGEHQWSTKFTFAQ